jgi:hypothetical protein
MVIFHSYVTVYQRVPIPSKILLRSENSPACFSGAFSETTAVEKHQKHRAGPVYFGDALGSLEQHHQVLDLISTRPEISLRISI